MAGTTCEVPATGTAGDVRAAGDVKHVVGEHPPAAPGKTAGGAEQPASANALDRRRQPGAPLRAGVIETNRQRLHAHWGDILVILTFAALAYILPVLAWRAWYGP